MPIGTSKLGVLGAGVVPGGTQTFNASGTFSVPPGVTRVNITGRGGTGNPGNAGNAGNSGNPGNGGGAGGGGSSAGPWPYGVYAFSASGRGGVAWKSNWPNSLRWPCSSPAPPGCGTPWWTCGAPPVYAPQISMGGAGRRALQNCGGNADQRSADAGAAGNAGNAGTAGNPGNSGNSSSTLCKTFPGGAGGNAGAGGAAGNAGSAGGAGASGGNYCNRGAGSGGSGAGSGGSGSTSPNANPTNFRTRGAYGGGGAGVVNDGSSGLSSSTGPNACFNSPSFCRIRGGTDPNLSAPFPPCNIYNIYVYPAPPVCAPVNTTGGLGGSSGNAGSAAVSQNQNLFFNNNANINNRSCLPLWSGNTANIRRSGGGGGASTTMAHAPLCFNSYLAGGGGGGGRGGVGGAGGNSSAPSGSAATPQTFNCVSVTPGGSVPVTVASPGGQIVISWNPQ